MIAYVRDGDMVVVHSMDRLARNLEDLRALVRTLTGKGARVQFLKENLTFTADASPMSTLVMNVMGSFAEFERAIIRERQREGVAIAKAKGVYTGRARVLTPDQVVEIQQEVAAGAKKTQLARKHGVARETVHRYLRNAAPLPPVATPETPSSAMLTLLLQLVPCNKDIRTTRLVDDIEWRVLRPFKPMAVRRGHEYRLAVTLTTAAELEAEMAGLWEMLRTYAKAGRCEAQGEIVDRRGRCWGSGHAHTDANLPER
jgi:DNA-binding phage protein